jgi:hypothetical protein
MQTSKNNELLDIKTILNEILNVTAKIENDQQLIFSKLKNLENRINNIDKNIGSKNKIDQDYIEDLKDLKKEKIELGEEEFFNAIKYKDYRSVLYIFKLYYKNKNNKYSSNVYPIRIISKRSFEYYCNNKWISDTYGTYTMNTIINNIEEWFMRHNSLDNSNITDDQFMLNQEFICKLSNEKYKKNIFKNIIEEVRINNI